MSLLLLLAQAKPNLEVHLVADFSDEPIGQSPPGLLLVLVSLLNKVDK